MTYTNKGLVEYAKKCLALGNDSIYLYGSFGQKLTTAFINQKAKQYVYNISRQSIYKKCMNSEGTEYAFDCVGLIKSYIWGGYGKVDYNKNQDVSANGMYNKAKVKGKISTMPETIGLLVHMSGHIGIYIGNGYVIECTPAKAFAKQNHGGGGVCKTKLTDRKWVHWLECPFIEYKEEVKTPTTTTTPSTSSLKYSKNNKIILNGYLYSTSDGVGKGAKKTNYKGTITIVKKGAAKPYHIDKLGWVAEKDIKLQSNVSYYPKCSMKYLSIVSALNSIGVNSSFEYRKKIAQKNGYSGDKYKGSSIQNINLLNKLKSGKLIKI